MNGGAAHAEQKAVVTGAGGFLGRYVVAALQSSGFAVRCHMGPPAECPRDQATVEAKDQMWADICDRDALTSLFAGVDVVIHLAGPPSVSASFQQPEEYVRTHVLGTTAVLETCRREARAPRVIYISSAEVYGRVDAEFVAEDQPLRPRSPYAAAKAGAEALVAAYSAGLGLPAVILRPFSLYGPGASPHSLLSELLAKLAHGQALTVRDMRPVRDFCYAGDVAAAVVCACRAPLRELLTCNVGTMRGSSVAELCRLLLSVAGRDGAFAEESSSRRPETSEIFRLVADNRVAREALEWAPSVSLEEGLALTVRNVLA